MFTWNDFFVFNQQIKQYIESVRQPKIYLYGLNDVTKRALMRLVDQEVYVTGFVVDETQSDLCDINYLNKSVISLAEISIEEPDICIIDVLGDNIVELKTLQNTVLPMYVPLANEVVLYGAGDCGRQVYAFLQSIQVNVKFFIDRDRAKQRSGYCGTKVMPLEHLTQEDVNVPILVALHDGKATEVREYICAHYPIKECYCYTDRWCFPIPHHGGLRMLKIYDDISIDSVIIDKMIVEQSRRKKIILYGQGSILPVYANKLSYFDITVDVLMDLDGNIVGGSALETDLLYETSDSASVWVLPDSESEECAKRLIHNLGLPIEMFYGMASGGSVVNHLQYYDPNLGFNIRYGEHDSYVLLKTYHHATPPVKRLGILGGSTTDAIFFNEISWPKHLANIMAEHEINCDIYAGAVAGYTVAQELVKFIRDLSHLSLDVLISYSRINEIHHDFFNFVGLMPETNNHFIHKFQYRLFSSLTKLHKQHPATGMTLRRGNGEDSSPVPPFCIGSGIKDIGEHWLHQEQMMYAICCELGIKFYAIFQPYLADKIPLTPRDKALLEIDGCYTGYIKEKQTEFKNKIRLEKHKYPWLYDFTEIFNGMTEDLYFDSCHLTADGNKILAQHVWQLIQSEF